MMLKFFGQEQRQRPQDKTPRPNLGVVPDNSISIEPVDDILAELEKLAEQNSQKKNKGCGCWGPST